MMHILDLGKAPVSRVIMLASLITCVLLYLQLIEIYQIYFNFQFIFKKFEIWRLFTSLLYFGPFSFQNGIQLFVFFVILKEIELKFYSNRPADFLIFLGFGLIPTWIFASIAKTVYFIGQIYFSSYLLFYYSKRSDTRYITFQIPSSYITFFLAIMEFALSGFDIRRSAIILTVFAHLYFFSHDVIGLKYHLRPLTASLEVNNFFSKILSS